LQAFTTDRRRPASELSEAAVPAHTARDKEQCRRRHRAFTFEQ